MSELKDNYQNLTTEELLKRRALGEDGLSMQAHKVIEEILTERGINVPPIPTKSVIVNNKESSSAIGKIGIVAIFLFLSGLVETLINQSPTYRIFAFIFSALLLVYWAYKKIQKINMTEEEKKEYELSDKLGKEGFTELMYCSVIGDYKRVVELINYGVDINGQDFKGTTALMYAISNNHVEIVKFLLVNGADVNLKTNKGNTAHSFATNYGNDEIKKIFKIVL